MPVYEFLCSACNRIYSFHSFRVETTKVPKCPKCGASKTKFTKLEDKAAKSEVIETAGGLKLGVIEVPAFYRDFAAQAAGDQDFRSTTRDVRALLDGLRAERVDGVIIDLRRNGGGSLSEATELTGLFIEKGPVVQVRDASGKIEVERDPDPEQVYEGPLAVLVDRNSASASEIFAGAIQDYSRGLIIGEPTFGKGTVQTVLPLRNGSGIKLTTALYYTPSGRSIQAEGITPDIELEPLELSAKEKDGIDPLKEADLSRHLDNGNGKDGKDTEKDGDAPDNGGLAQSDYELYEALNMLKGLAILQERMQ